jgi:hypothetical protein
MAITENTTLGNLTYGTHNITINAWDIAGNVGSSETVTFAVTKPESLAPFPILPLIAVIVVVVTACAGLLVFFKKHKRKAEKV